MTEDKIHVLIIEDDAIDQMAYERFFKKEDVPYNYTFADSVKSAKSELSENSFDIIISDYMLGDGTAIDLFPDFKETPVIVVTGTGDEETAVKAMKLGASDYLIKDPGGSYLKVLPATVKNALDRRQAEEELKKYRESLEELVKERTIKLEKEIKERKKAEKTLKDSEDSMRALLNATKESAMLVDIEGRILAMNEIATKRLGKSAESLIGLEMIDYISPDIAKSRKAYSEEVQRTGKPVNFQDEREGRIYNNNLYPVFNTEGNVNGFAVYAKDITENIEMEKKLKQETEFSNNILEALIDTVFVFDPETGKPFRWNKAFTDISGFSNEEIASMKAPDSWYDSEDLEKAGIEINKMLQGKKTIIEMNLLTKDERSIPTEYTATIIEGIDNSIKYIIVVGRDLTERKKAEESIKESEERLRSLIENMPIVCFTFDKEGNILSWNKAAEQIYGYGREEAIGASAYDLIVTPKTREATKSVIESIFLGETISGTEWQDQNKKGEVGWRMGNGFPLLRADGSVDCGVNLNVDITERKQMEEKIKQAEKKYRTLFEVAGDAIFTIQVAGNDLNIIDCNARTIEIFGYEREELLGKSPVDLSPYKQPDGSKSEEKAQKISGLVLEGNPQFFEWKHNRKDGTFFDAEVTLNNLEIGNENCLLAIVRDITDRKKAENTLQLILKETSYRTGEEYFRSLVHQLAITLGIRYALVGELIGNNRIRTLSVCSGDGFAENFEYDLKHTPCDNVMQRSICLYQRDVQQQFPQDELLVEMGVESYLGAPVIDIKGRIWGVLVVMDTCPMEEVPQARQLLEFFASRAAAELVREKVEEEHRKLETQLYQAQKMEALGTLAGGIAHDFNNILSIIFGYVDLAIIDINMPDKVLKNLDKVTQGAGRAKELINQILTLSRRTEQMKQPLRISLIVKEAMKLLQSTIPASIEIKQDIESQGTVMADSTQIHQIVMNLCTNAYHAMRKTGGTLAVSLKDMEITDNDIVPGLDISPGKYLRLEVGDTGHGMDKEIKEKIFEPYFTTKEIDEGTGLGLAVVHGIVKSHNGYINVISERGDGTTFHIYLPVVAEKPVSPGITHQKEPVKGGREKIMVVDDEEKIVDIINEILVKCGYEVNIYNNSIQAFQEFEKNPEHYNLIITDMTMPKMNGVELAKKILELKSQIPIILCSGYSELIDKEMVDKMGLHYFPKPIVMSDLVRTVRNLLDKVQV